MANNVYVLNEKLFENKIVIFGTGVWAKRAFFTLLEEGVMVECFADRNTDSKFLMGKRVLFEDDLIQSNYTVIVASSYWEEIVDRLSRKGIENIYVMNIYAENKYGIEI